jgi:hypothetical protein
MKAENRIIFYKSPYEQSIITLLLSRPQYTRFKSSNKVKFCCKIVYGIIILHTNYSLLQHKRKDIGGFKGGMNFILSTKFQDHDGKTYVRTVGAREKI